MKTIHCKAECLSEVKTLWLGGSREDPDNWIESMWLDYQPGDMTRYSLVFTQLHHLRGIEFCVSHGALSGGSYSACYVFDTNEMAPLSAGYVGEKLNIASPGSALLVSLAIAKALGKRAYVVRKIVEDGKLSLGRVRKEIEGSKKDDYQYIIEP